MSQEHSPVAPPLASALLGVKLRSAALCPHRDEHAGAATLTASAALAAALQTEREHNARLRAVDLESWYDSISDKTFKTIFLPLAPNEARCIAQEYHRKITRAASGATQDISSYVHDTEDDTCLLQARISDALAALGGHGECQALRGAWCRAVKKCAQRMHDRSRNGNDCWPNNRLPGTLRRGSVCRMKPIDASKKKSKCCIRRRKNNS